MCIMRFALPPVGLRAGKLSSVMEKVGIILCLPDLSLSWPGVRGTIETADHVYLGEEMGGHQSASQGW